MAKLLLVDLSGIAYALWHVSGQEPDQDYVSRGTVARVHGLAQGFDGAAVCCDAPRNFRKQISPAYKSQRESNEVVKHQLRLAQEQLARDGFAVWQADGFEADDVIASAVRSLDDGETQIMIASSDKDLLQLVGGLVRVRSLSNGAEYGPEEVRAKFGVSPAQMCDLLCLMGDKSDNVAGVAGVGKVRGAELLQKHGTLFDLYGKLGESCTVLGLTPSIFTALKENVQNVELARKLITLRTDVELPFADIFKPRAPQNAEELAQEETDMADVIDNDTGEVMQSPEPDAKKSEPPPPPPKGESAKPATNVVPIKATDDLKAPSVALATVDWESELEPRGLNQVKWYSERLFAARLFDGYGTCEGVMTTILLGRELGLGMMGSLRGIHLMDVRGKKKHALSADLMAALVLQSGKAKFFEPVELTATQATYRTQRVGAEKPFTLSFNISEAKQAGLIKAGGGWETWPLDMCKARCVARLARTIYPDVCFGLYVSEELEAA